ncbi:MAG TPA: hypothetical protein VLL25_00040, partial [Acidimicrobiales bacterium]|nr:hypothetical protein [Acidimicrobiales bacterium]
DRLLQLISARRPGLDPHQLVPVGWTQVRASIERFIAAGFSKFVLLPAEEPPNWADELAEAAAEVLPLQGSR